MGLRRPRMISNKFFMSLQEIDPVITQLLFPLSKYPKKCAYCGAVDNIVSCVIAVEPLYTCAKCYYCLAPFKTGKNKGKPCLRPKACCKRHPPQ